MSEVAQSSPGPLPEGYVEVSAGGYEMVLYKGFVRVARVVPPGGEPVQLYEQQGRYDVPGGRPPAARSNVVLRGGAQGRDVHLHVVNDPRAGQQKGPVDAVRVTLGAPGPDGPVVNRPDLVQIVRGADQVVRIDVAVHRAPSAEDPALLPPEPPAEAAPPPAAPVSPDDPWPPEVWEFEDNTSTCPYDCG